MRYAPDCQEILRKQRILVSFDRPAVFERWLCAGTILLMIENLFEELSCEAMLPGNIERSGKPADNRAGSLGSHQSLLMQYGHNL